MSAEGSNGIYSQLEQMRMATIDEYLVSRRAQSYMDEVVDIAATTMRESFNSPELLGERANEVAATIGGLAAKYEIDNPSIFLLSVTGRNILKPKTEIVFNNDTDTTQIILDKSAPSGQDIIECKGTLAGFRFEASLHNKEYQLVPKMRVQLREGQMGFVMQGEGGPLLDCDFTTFAEATLDESLNIDVVHASASQAYLSALAEAERYGSEYPWFSEAVDALDARMKFENNPERIGRVLSELGKVIDTKAPSSEDFENGLRIIGTILDNTTLDVTGDIPTTEGQVKRLTARGNFSNLSGAFGEQASTLVLSAFIINDDEKREEILYHFPLSSIRRITRLA